MDLKQKAKRVIDGNWKNGFTIPSAKLYPFQWMWDSGFVAMGTATYDLKKAFEEVNSMLSGQWENGMIPHILFHSEAEKTYFPNFDFWNSNVNSGAPEFPKSSGITQPPVFGFVIEQILEQHPEDESVKAFIKLVYPKIAAYHKFLYEYRDHLKDGLFFIFHPWESGRDNSPLWDGSLDRIKIDKALLPVYTRMDIQIADASERPTMEQYDRYVYLLELGKRFKYDESGIAEESPFLVQDCMMNAILIRSNDSLIKIGKTFGFDTSYLEKKQALSKLNFPKKFWNEELNCFVSFDARIGAQIKLKEIGGLISLFAGVASPEQAALQADYLKELHDRNFYLCPSFDVDHPLFDSKRYWRGPVWPQMNWMIYKGLKHYNYEELAQIVKSDILELSETCGLYEYFESEKAKSIGLEKGYGGNNFSWTASTVLHLLAD